MDHDQNFFLFKKEDGSVYGPLSLSELKTWASQAFISPSDKVSTDQITWNRAPLLAELQMDYLIQLDGGDLYGPTTLGAIQEFLKAGEIHSETLVINCLEGTTTSVVNLSFPDNEQAIEIFENSLVTDANDPRVLHERIKELEATVNEQARHIEELEKDCKSFKEQLEALSGSPTT